MPPDPAATAKVFQDQGYAVIRGLVAPQRVAMVRKHLEARAGAGTMIMSGDDQVPKTPCVYGDGVVDGLMGDIKPLIEAHTGLKLYPTYSYARIYKTGDKLDPHRDRPACEISISLNLGQEPDEPWALNVGEKDAPFAAMLHPGDVLLYRGCDFTHWREPYQGNKLVQVFVHYVDANGPHAHEKFDSRASLGNAFQPEVTGRIAPFVGPNYTGR